MIKKDLSKIKLPAYDFLGSIYKNTQAEELKETLDSIKDQTLKPKNIILVIDGFISNDVNCIVEEYIKILPIKIIYIKENVGLGPALRIGMQKCKSDIILRFDTDDINFKNRAYFTVKELAEGDVDIVGSNIYEFISNPNKLISKKKMPLSHKAISRTLLYRNPINHPTVGFLKKSVIQLKGGYRKFPFYEDYDLWIRALHNNLKFKNIDKELVAVRINEQRKRRKGLNLLGSEIRLFFTFSEKDILHGLIFLPFLLCRLAFILLPLNIIKYIYRNFFRQKVNH